MKLCRFAFGFKASFLEDFKLSASAGLLTCPRFEPPSHSDQSKQWQRYLSKRCIGLTVAGLFRICTWFPLRRWCPKDI